jgi:tRNA (guanine-N7-)-methyltransferase
VRREGRLTAGQQRALDAVWPVYGLEFSQAPVDFDNVFSREAPRVLEIGFGNGESLAEQARTHPEWDVIGREVHRPGVGHLLQLLQREQISNVRVWCHDAVEVLNAAVADGTLQQVSVYFPDPWPKKRHHKRRLLQPAFVEQLATKLRPGGVLHVATDWADYAVFARETLAASTRFEPAALDAALPRPATKFEHRGVGKGHAVTDLVYRRIR